MQAAIKEYNCHMHYFMLYNKVIKVVDIFSRDFRGKKLCSHWDSNSKPSGPVDLNHSRNFNKGLDHFQLAARTCTLGDLAMSAFGPDGLISWLACHHFTAESC